MAKCKALTGLVIKGLNILKSGMPIGKCTSLLLLLSPATLTATDVGVALVDIAKHMCLHISSTSGPGKHVNCWQKRNHMSLSHCTEREIMHREHSMHHITLSHWNETVTGFP